MSPLGAEWAGRVEGYFACGFDNDSMIKVVATLKNAWKRNAEQMKMNDDKQQQNIGEKKSNKRILF